MQRNIQEFNLLWTMFWNCENYKMLLEVETQNI